MSAQPPHRDTSCLGWMWGGPEIPLQSRQNSHSSHSSSQTQARRQNDPMNTMSQPAPSTSSGEICTVVGTSECVTRDEEMDERLLPDDKLTRLKTETVHDQREGYGRLASFLNSDHNFRMARRHGYVRMRLILYKQYRIEKLRQEMDAMDEEDENGAGVDQHRLFSLDWEEKQKSSRRIELFKRLQEELKEYDELLLREHFINGLHKPRNRNFHSVYNYLFDERPLADTDMVAFYYKNDFASLAHGKEHTWLEAKIEEALRYMPKAISQLFTTPDDRMKTADDTATYYSPERLRLAAKAITMAMATACILLPMMLLFAFADSKKAKIATVLGFGLTFPAIIAMCSNIEPNQVFIMSAAYFAVLVVFLGNADDKCCVNVNK